MNRVRLRMLLVKHEALRLKPYRDSVGKLTIGVGRNLDDVGISNDEARVLMENDIENALAVARRWIPGFDQLNDVRQDALIDMAFNLGDRLGLFHKTLTALQEKRFEDAAAEMLDSAWAKEVGDRAVELAEMVKNG